MARRFRFRPGTEEPAIRPQRCLGPVGDRIVHSRGVEGTTHAGEAGRLGRSPGQGAVAKRSGSSRGGPRQRGACSVNRGRADTVHPTHTQADLAANPRELPSKRASTDLGSSRRRPVAPAEGVAREIKRFAWDPASSSPDLVHRPFRLPRPAPHRGRRLVFPEIPAHVSHDPTSRACLDRRFDLKCRRPVVNARPSQSPTSTMIGER